MCGISGLIALARDGRVSRTDLRAMTDALAHRGPDGDGLWLGGDGRTGFGHRRLAIVDLDPRAAQPMQDASGRLCVTFNGEIYNHRRLRSKLEAAGQSFRTDHSDTEVLLAGYAAWGLEGLLTRLEGMFAFALHDALNGDTFIARDRLGIKPVYFTETGGVFGFASEIKALLACKAGTARLCPTATYHYLSFATAPAPLTLLAGIAKLPAGHYLRIARDGEVTPHRYWDPARFFCSGASTGRDGARKAVRRALESAVYDMMVADVPVGLFLSGGVDSGSLLALMTARSEHPVHSFTVGFENGPAELDEIEAARAMAARHGALHREVIVTEGDAQECLFDLARSQDEPLADWVCVPLFFVAKLAHESDIKAVLIGEGADELFCGYRQYLRSLRLMRRFRHARLLPEPLRKAGENLLDQALPDARAGLRRAADTLWRGLSGQNVFWSGALFLAELNKRALIPDRRVEPAWDAYGLAGPITAAQSSAAVVETAAHNLDRVCPYIDDLARLRHQELSLRLPELLLMRADKMTMAHSVEARVPFLDHRMVELALGLDQETLVPGGRPKALLKDALSGLLPRSTLDAEKKGFGAPVSAWLRSGFGHEMETIVARSVALDEIGMDRRLVSRYFGIHRSGKRDLSMILWPIINLAIWHHRWIGNPATE